VIKNEYWTAKGVYIASVNGVPHVAQELLR
jgi:hypothetical protein